MKFHNNWLGALGAVVILSIQGIACSTVVFNSSSSRAPQNTDAPKSAGVLSRELAAIRAKQIAHVSYILWFGLDAEHEDFQGRTVINFQLREKARDASPDLFLDFAGGQIHSLNINGVFLPENQIAASYNGQQIQLKIRDLQSGSNRIEIAYTHPYASSGSGLWRLKDTTDGAIYLNSSIQPYGANRIFPCFDQLDLKAPFEVAVEAPEDWEVVSNTLERDITKVDGRRSWAFPPTPVLSPYLFALHAGPYSSWKADANGVPLRLFARQSLAHSAQAQEWSKNWLETTRIGLDFFSTQLNHAYPFTKYDQILVPTFKKGSETHPASESAAAISFSEDWIAPAKARHRTHAILHPMAHMWFGGFVTPRWWNGLWLSESFSTFSATWAADQAFQDPEAWETFFSAEKRHSYEEDRRVTTRAVDSPVPDTQTALENFDSILTGKGTAIIRQLVFELGEDDFKEGLQRYFHKFAFRNSTLADFFRVLSEASGDNLKEWETAWLKTSGTNTIEALWECATDEKTGRSLIASFSLKQSASSAHPKLRPHKTQIGLYRWPKKSGDKNAQFLRVSETIVTHYTGAETAVNEAVGKPCPDFVFPNHQDMDFVKVVLDPKSMTFAKTYLSQIEPTLTRQILWQRFREQVIESELPAQDFLELAFRHLPREKQVLVRSDVMDFIAPKQEQNPIIFNYLAPELHEKYRQKIKEFTAKKPFKNDRNKTTEPTEAPIRKK